MDEPLVGDEIEFAVMDEVHLGRTGFLDGILDGKYIYRYKERILQCASPMPSFNLIAIPGKPHIQPSSFSTFSSSHTRNVLEDFKEEEAAR